MNQHEKFQSYSRIGIHEKMIKEHLVFAILFRFCGPFSFSEFGNGFSVAALFSGSVCFCFIFTSTALWLLFYLPV